MQLMHRAKKYTGPNYPIQFVGLPAFFGPGLQSPWPLQMLLQGWMTEVNRIN